MMSVLEATPGIKLAYPQGGHRYGTGEMDGTFDITENIYEDFRHVFQYQDSHTVAGRVLSVALPLLHFTP